MGKAEIGECSRSLMPEQVITSSPRVSSSGPLLLRKRWPASLPWWGLLLAIVLIAAAVISRKPELVTNPQFWGDEASWFADAYSNGVLHSLLLAQGGYLCVASKLPVLLAIHVPLAHAPAVFGWFTAGAQVLLGGFLLTSRLTRAAPIQARALLCFLWIAVPNCAEIDTLNNTQWTFAVLGALVLLSEPPKAKAWIAFDFVAICLISLTGPFCILLLPVGILFYLMRRNRWTIVLSSILAAGSVIQYITLSHYLGPCSPVRVLKPLLLRVLAGQLFLFGTVNGGKIVADAPLQSRAAAGLGALIVVIGLCIVGYVLVRAPLELKLLTVFGCAVAVAVIRRLHCDPHWDWESLTNIFYAIRYWYIPRLVLLAILVWMIGRGHASWIRAATAVAVILIVASALSNWQYPPLTDLHFDRYAREFDHAPRGTRITIPVNPIGWSLTLVKH